MTKLLSAEAKGQEDCWDKIAVVFEIDGKRVTGTILCEIDGRDVEFEGDIEAFHDLPGIGDLEAIWSDPAALDMFEKACVACGPH